MAVRVPDTNTYGLTDVVAAVQDHAGSITGTLQDAFNNAISGYFDSTYNNDTYAVANSQKRFRNYGPTGTPVTGSYTLPFPSSWDDYRLVGRLIYVSPNGLNLFAYCTYLQPNEVLAHLLFRFTMAQANVMSTIAYHSERNLGAVPTGTSAKTMRFTPTGDRFYIVYDIASLHSGSQTMYTWHLGSNWDITDVDSFNSFTFNAHYTVVKRRAMRMSFIEDGSVLMVYYRYNGTETIAYYNLASNFIIPDGGITANGDFQFTDDNFTNTITAFGVFDNSFSPGKIEVGLNTVDGFVNMMTVRLDNSPWYAVYPLVSDFYFNTFPVSDIYTMAVREYSYILESNPNALDPLKPRVYFRIN
jgi:hypothetical protein